jgi:alpha-aminoadipate carrier protein LysW
LAVVRCPECSVDLDVDEDEVEEGEILNCPECEVEIEVVQVHPVRLNVISDDDDDEEEAEGDEKEGLESDALSEEEDEVE